MTILNAEQALLDISEAIHRDENHPGVRAPRELRNEIRIIIARYVVGAAKETS